MALLCIKAEVQVTAILPDPTHVRPPPKKVLKSNFYAGFFAQITPRNCLIFMFTPSLPNHARCQVDLSRNNAIFSSNSRFNALRYFQ